jgi:hypothetical protein
MTNATKSPAAHHVPKRSDMGTAEGRLPSTPGVREIGSGSFKGRFRGRLLDQLAGSRLRDPVGLMTE